MGRAVPAQVSSGTSSAAWYSEVKVTDEEHEVPEREDAVEAAIRLDDLDDEDPDHPLNQRPPGADDRLADELAEDLASLRKQRRGRRIPIASGIVVAVGAYLLWSLFADFSYWIRGERSLQDLGQVSDIMSGGQFKGHYDNLYVELEGHPDVQHAARLRTDGKGDRAQIGYVRIIEGGGSLFAAVPGEASRDPDTFSGRFKGRMRRLDRTRTYAWVKQFFDEERIVQTIEVDRDGLAAALEAGSLQFDSEVGTLTVTGDDRMILIFRPGQALLQMGRGTWKTQADADAAVESLGVPWARLDPETDAPAEVDPDDPTPRRRPLFRSYVVELDKARFDATEKSLNAGKDVPASNQDPKKGALLLPYSATYVVDPTTLELSNGQLGFDFGDNITEPGWQAEGDRLVPRKLQAARLALPLAELDGARLERPIVVNPAGYVILVDDQPADHWMSALLWLLVAGLVGVNAGALVLELRRRMSAPETAA